MLNTRALTHALTCVTSLTEAAAMSLSSWPSCSFSCSNIALRCDTSSLWYAGANRSLKHCYHKTHIHSPKTAWPIITTSVLSTNPLHAESYICSISWLMSLLCNTTYDAIKISSQIAFDVRQVYIIPCENRTSCTCTNYTFVAHLSIMSHVTKGISCTRQEKKKRTLS